MAVLPFKVPESIEIKTLKENYGKFVLSPLERGYGITIGHAMKDRRSAA